MGANLGCDVGRVCYFIVSGEVMEAIMVVGERAMVLMAIPRSMPLSLSVLRRRYTRLIIYFCFVSIKPLRLGARSRARASV